METIQAKADCSTPQLVTKTTGPPFDTIKVSTCIKFDDAIIIIPEYLYDATDPMFGGNSPRGGANITGVIGNYIEAVFKFAFLKNKITELTLPKVEVIGESAFQDNFITKLSLPKVNKIDERAFYNNVITELSLPEVIGIKVSAFQDNFITKLSLPKVQTIEGSAFRNNKISEVNLPNAITIGSYAFMDNEISELSLPEVTQIATEAFRNNNITKLILPKVTRITNNAFKDNPISEMYFGSGTVVNTGLNVEPFPAPIDKSNVKVYLPDDETLGRYQASAYWSLFDLTVGLPPVPPDSKVMKIKQIRIKQGKVEIRPRK